MNVRGNGRSYTGSDGDPRILSLLQWLALLVFVAPLPAAAGLRLVPSVVRMGAFFNGENVKVSGSIPAGSSAVVEVFGKRTEAELLRKGRHWDIWMNVGEIDIEAAPCLYFALSSDPSGASLMDADGRFGYTALQKRVSFKGDVQGWTHADVFHQFIALKEDKKLYRLLPGALAVSRSSAGLSSVSGNFHIPSRVTPGQYRVRISVVDRGRVIHTASASLDIRRVGLPALLTSLSREHGALHGVLAVVIAVIFGFLVGVIFKGRKR